MATIKEKGFTIIKAQASHAAYISLLGRITFTETFGHLFRDPQDLREYYQQTFSVNKIRKSIEKSTNQFWLAFVDDLPVGYAKLKLDSPSPFLSETECCQLQKIYVLKDFLSLKIGGALQQQLQTTAQELRFKKIWLSVLDSNERAIQFYKRKGYEQVGKHDFQIGKEYFEFLVMARSLLEE